MDTVHCQDGDDQRARLGAEEGNPEGSRLEDQVETARARWNAYAQKSVPGLLRLFARGWSMSDTLDPKKEEKQSAVMGAGGGVYIIGWGTEAGRRRRRCP